MLNVITTSLPCILPVVVFPKALFLALYSSSCTLPLSVLWSLPLITTTVPPLRRWHSALLLFPPTDRWLKHFLPLIRCSWMTANILTLDSSETEFLLIWLKNQLAKIHNSSLDTSHSARNLGFIFDEHLTFSDQITSLSKACYYHIRQIRYIRPRFVNCLYHCYLSFTPTWLL